MEETVSGNASCARKTRRGLRRIVSALVSVGAAAAVLLALALAGVRAAGLQPFTILSGSMEPAYPVGALIYVKSAAPDEIAMGDPITFVLNEELVIATHRVVRIDAANSCFYTKGDANAAEDGSPVHFNNLIGKPVFCIPKLGYVAGYISSAPGMYVAAACAAALILALFIPDILRLADKADKKAARKGRQRKGA